MLKCPGPSAFKHIRMSGATFGGHVPWLLCSGSGEEQVSGATLGSYFWDVVIPQVELTRWRSSTRGI